MDALEDVQSFCRAVRSLRSRTGFGLRSPCGEIGWTDRMNRNLLAKLSYLRFRPLNRESCCGSKLTRTRCEHIFSALPSNSGIARYLRHVSNWPKNRLMRCSKQAYSITWLAPAIWRWASFECRRLGFRGTTRCSWDNSPRPGAGEKLSLLRQS